MSRFECQTQLKFAPFYGSGPMAFPIGVKMAPETRPRAPDNTSI